MRLESTGTTGRLTGEVEIPVSKYHAHRALVLASLAPGVSRIRGVSRTRQLEWTVGVLRALGTGIEIDGDDYVVTGGPYRVQDGTIRGSRSGGGVLDVGSSGTTLYFMIGLASLADRPTTVTGMKYFQRRPVGALLASLKQMGLGLEAEADRPPVHVEARRPRGGDVEIAGTLSQWVSGLLLVAPFAERDTTIRITGGRLNERPYVDLTVRMMRHWGLAVDVADDGLTYRVPAGQTATPADYTLPPDVGSAAFGVAAAALHPSDVLFRGMTEFTSEAVDHPESEFLDLATAMGVPWERDDATGFVRIRHDGLDLAPLDVDCTPIPDLLPVLSAMAAFARGTSTFRNVGHIRLKESDRVSAMLQLNRMGGEAEQTETELTVRGTERLRAASLSSFNDHRVLMALAIAASRAEGTSTLTYPRAYRVSYPEFLVAMNDIGLAMDVPARDAERAAVPDADEDEATTSGAGPGLPDADPLVLVESVRHAIETTPDAPAVIEAGADGAVATTWRELGEEADRVSAVLVALGVERGDAVAVQLPNWREFVAVALGTLQIGAVATPIMPAFGPREVAMTLSRSKARVLVTPDVFRQRRPALELIDVAAEARAQDRALALEHVIVIRTGDRGRAYAASAIPPVPAGAIEAADTMDWSWHWYRETLRSVEPDRAEIARLAPGPDDVCQLLFTSGTTGEPKGVQHTHRTLGLATAMHVAHSGLGADDRVYVPSPLAHQTGFLYGMLLAWRLEVATVIQPVWDGRVALEQAFGAGRATFVQAATPFLTDLVRLVEDGAPVPASLRMFVVTGAAVPRELARRAYDVLGASILGAFGTTETCLGALAGPSDAPQDAWGTDGRALGGIRLRIVDGDRREVPAGTEGEFELASPTMFGGYLDRPDLTADAFTADGWYRTGDLATIDERGFLRITGRMKDVINRGGEKVPVVEVENLLYQHPSVADAAVVAMPDARLGERACAFVVPAGAARLGFREMQDHLAGRGLSKYYWPERLELVDELPRNPVGKVQKNVLRERAARLVAETPASTADAAGRKVEA